MLDGTLVTVVKAEFSPCPQFERRQLCLKDHLLMNMNVVLNIAPQPF
jgi:hypothetical protein